MDLSSFLQKDITAFLDRTEEEMHKESPSAVRSEEFSVFNEDRDYAKETDHAIADNNLAKAKEVFDELRRAFNHHSTNDEEREKIYTILQEVYGKIIAYLEQQPFALQGELAQFAGKSLNEHLQATSEEAAGFEEEARAEEAKRRALEEDLRTKQGELTQALENKDLEQAMKAYHEFKDAFGAYPSEDKFRKIEWYNNVLSAFEQTRRLKEQLQMEREEEQRARKQARKKLAANRQAAAQAATPLQEESPERKKALQGIKTLIKALIDELEEGDSAKAHKLLMDARQAVSSLEDEAKEKTPLEGILSAITDRLAFYQQQPQAKEAAPELAEEAGTAPHEEAASRHYFEETGRLSQSAATANRQPRGGPMRP